VEFACLGVSFRIFLEGDSEYLFWKRRIRLFQCWLSLTSSRLFSFHYCYFLMVQKQFIHLSVYALSMIATVFVWVFDSLACIQFSVQRAFWVSRELRLWLFAYVSPYLSYVQWFLIESFFDYFWKWQLLQPVKRLQMQLLLWIAMLLVLINCWVRVVSVSSVSVWIPLTITFNLIMITILLCAKTFACLLVLFIQSEWFLISMHSEEEENLAECCSRI